MNKPKYLSPSSLALFEKQPEEFYFRHLAERKAPRQLQDKPAAAGSSFDAHVKSSLGGFGLDELFEAQVEPQNREWARRVGHHLYSEYVKSGALDKLCALLNRSSTQPRFEFSIEAEVGGVPLLGKPDCQFDLPVVGCPVHCILDWKVNGANSKSAVSPYKFYADCGGKPHKGFRPVDYFGLTIHDGCLSETNSDWADQLAIYAWLLGNPVGSEFIVLIDQLVCKPTDGLPIVRVAQHRTRISKEWQEKLLVRVQNAWHAIDTGHIFNLSREDSDAKCQQLDLESLAMVGDGDWSDFFARSARPGYRG